ncbi:MAG: ATP-grasp domain-containing protein [Gammaproteobacteria bacterium]|nr:ATP-grasp domain-containing protein [Gammaproteobacteria bacterium]
MQSRYGHAFTLPWQDAGEAALLELLQRVGRQLPVRGVLIACGDDYVMFLSQHRAALDAYYEFVLPDKKTLERLGSKKFQYQLAQEAGVPIPQTFSLNHDLGPVASTIHFPCVVKPVYSHQWAEYQERAGIVRKVKLLVAHSPQELAEQARIIADSGIEWVAQELVEGADNQLYAFYAYFDRTSQLLAAFVRRKLRQWPVNFGNGSYSVGVREDEVIDLGVKLFRSIGYQGLTNTEFKRDSKDGRFKLIEINVRSASQVNLAIDSGVDLPYIAYQDILQKPVQPILTYRQGVKWINLTSDIRAFLEYRRRGQLGLGGWLASLAGVRSHAYFACDDPLPAVSMAGKAIKGKLANVFGRQRV